jgi:hypothetical protein
MTEEHKHIGYIERAEGFYNLYAPIKGQIVTKAFILCKYCKSTIYPCAGPKYNAVCFTCYDNGAHNEYVQTVDSNEKASAFMEARLWEFIDMAAMWPKAKPDSRIWDHVMVYAPKKEWVGLTEREVELIDEMIETQLLHAERCDHMANSTMAQKQKAWDLERVELLRKLKEKNI